MTLAASTRQHLWRHPGPGQASPFVLVYHRVLGFEGASYFSLYKSGEVLHISYETRLCRSLRLPPVSKASLIAMVNRRCTLKFIMTVSNLGVCLVDNLV